MPSPERGGQDRQRAIAEVTAQLTGPGGPFEVITETVDGVEMKVYKNRLPSLRAVAQLAASRGDDTTFLVYGDRRLGFGTFVRTVNSVSHGFADRFGVRRGDRVAVLSANNPEWCLAFWATVDIGAILVGLNGWWKTDEILYGLRDSGARVLVADARRFERVADEVLAGRLPELEAVVLIDADPAQFGGGPLLHRFDELTTAPTEKFPDTPIDEDDAAVIFYTSGTTGRPKGAISSHRNMIANLQNTLFNTAAGTAVGAAAIPASESGSGPVAESASLGRPEAAGLGAAGPGAAGLGAAGPGAAEARADTGSGQQAALFTSPLFHVSGCHSSLVVGLLAGLKLVMPVGRFEPELALELIEREHVTIWATVPTMVWRVCEFPDRDRYDTTSVISVAFGGSPSAEELQRKIRETFPNVRTTSNAYGLTESSSVATVISGADAVARPWSVGRPMPVVDIRIVDSADHDVPTGATGEVLIKGPIIMRGYWNKPEATAATVRDGWLHTGDIGFVDADGFLSITDRAKDMIIRGGENVYCVEIENRLVDHPSIADAAVFGVPHPSLGEEVKAVVEIEPGQSITAGEVRAWVAETLADFKVPTHVELRYEHLPRNASGKLLKNVLRGEGEVSFAETM